MKKIGIILISFVLLSTSAGCRPTGPSEDEPLSPTPSVSITDGIVTFENTALMNSYTENAHQLYDDTRPWAEDDYVHLDFLTQQLEFEKAEYIYPNQRVYGLDFVPV